MAAHSGKKEAVYTFAATVASKVFTYVLLIALANLFTKEIYGRAAFVIALFDLSVFLGSVGVPHILSPWITKKKDVRSVFYFIMFVSFIFMILGLIVSIRYPWILPIVLSYPLLFLRNIAGSFTQSNFKYHINQVAGTIYILVTFIFVVLLREQAHHGIIIAYALGYVANTIIVVYTARREIKAMLSKFGMNVNHLKEYLKKSLVISVLYISFLFLKWIDTAFLGLLSTFESVASYNVAAPIANSVSVISIPLSLYLLSKAPTIIDKKHSLTILKSALRISLSLTLFSLILINSISHLLIQWFFPQYAGVEIYIMLLSIGMLFFALYSPIYYYIAGKLKPEIGLSSILTAALINIALDIILIPYFDIYGIVIATTIAHVVAFVMLFRRLGILSDFITVFPIAIFILLSYFLGYYGLLLLPFAILTIFYLRLFTKNDYMIIKGTLQSMIKK